jgi:hypothetical protein
MCVFTGHDYWMVSLQEIMHSIPCSCISYYQMNDWEFNSQPLKMCDIEVKSHLIDKCDMMFKIYYIQGLQLCFTEHLSKSLYERILGSYQFNCENQLWVQAISPNEHWWI